MKRGVTLALLATLGVASALHLMEIAVAKKWAESNTILPDVALAAREVIPLKEAKLNIEHNVTDGDTGFQGFIDSEGWDELEVKGPDGVVLTLRARRDLAALGMTELFFETVEPENADVPLDELLETLPEGHYGIAGTAIEDGARIGPTAGIAWLTHAIPAGPELLTPPPGARVGLNGVLMSWSPVTATIDGGPVTLIAYQLIVEKDVEPHPHMIGKFGLSMYLPPSVTSIILPDSFVEPGTHYQWEVLAIEESGNQTLSSAEFETE